MPDSREALQAVALMADGLLDQCRKLGIVCTLSIAVAVENDDNVAVTTRSNCEPQGVAIMLDAINHMHREICDVKEQGTVGHSTH